MSTVRLALPQLAHIPKKEATYGGGIGDGEAGWLRTTYKGEPTVPKPNVVYSNQTGRGHEFRSTIRKINQWDVRVQRSMDLDPYSAGLAIGFALGQVSTSSSGSGYAHVFKPLVLSSNAPQLPSTSMVEYYPDEGLKQKLYGLIFDEVTLSGSKGTWCQLGYTAIGSGKIDKTTALSIPSETVAQPFLFSGMTACSADNGAALDLLDRLRSFSWSWQNNCLAEDGYLAGGTAWQNGFVRDRCEIGNRMDSGVLELVLDAERSGTNELDDLLDSVSWTDVTLSLQGALISGSTYHGVSIAIPEAKVDDLGDGWDGQVKTRTVKLSPIYDSGTSAPLTVTVTNDISAYLTAAA